MKAYSYPDGLLYFCLCDRGVRDAMDIGNESYYVNRLFLLFPDLRGYTVDSSSESLLRGRSQWKKDIQSDRP